MKKSVSSPSLLHGETSKRSSTIRRNAFSWNYLSDALPSEKTELVEKIDAVLPTSLSQKLLCYETYGFPSDILQSTIPPHEKSETLLDLASCLVTPEEPPSNAKPVQIRNTLSTNNEAVEERFQRMLINIRRRRKSLSMSL